MIHLRGQGLVMTIRRIWSIEPFKNVGDFAVDYDYSEDVEQQQTTVIVTAKPVGDEVSTDNFDGEKSPFDILLDILSDIL